MLMLLKEKPPQSYLATIVEKLDTNPRNVISVSISVLVQLTSPDWIRTLQSFLEDKLAALDVVAEEDNATVEENKPEVQDFVVGNK
jgi:hypothetical protein